MQSLHFLMRGEIVSCSTIWDIFYKENVCKICTIYKNTIKTFKVSIK